MIITSNASPGERGKEGKTKRAAWRAFPPPGTAEKSTPRRSRCDLPTQSLQSLASRLLEARRCHGYCGGFGRDAIEI